MMIDYLIADKFPAKGPTGKALKYQGDVEQFAQALVLRAELDALDDESLKSRYDAIAVPKAKAAEDARPFNQPYAKADFGHWAKLAYWKVDEGIALLLGRSPRFLVWESVKSIPSSLVWQFGTSAKWRCVLFTTNSSTIQDIRGPSSLGPNGSTSPFPPSWRKR